MAFTYIILNLVFMAAILFLFAKTITKPSKVWWITLGILLALTLVFDNFIILAGIVDYDPLKILGLRLGVAPVEDFFYAVFAVMIVPLLWQRFAPPTKGRHEPNA